MSELLPDTWNLQEEERGCCSRCVPRRGPVTDILVWLQCFTSLVAVLSPQYPNKVTHFMAYQRTIIKAQRCFVGDGWVTYDSTYRRAAAAAKSLDWGLIDFSLYNETFTGRARAIARCQHCLSEHHESKDCSDNADSEEIGFSRRYKSNTHITGKKYASCTMTNGGISAGFTLANLFTDVEFVKGHIHWQHVAERRNLAVIRLSNGGSKRISTRPQGLLTIIDLI